MEKRIIMTFINTFLQRSRLRENNHGIYMIFVAYTLSILLLVIGSDTFYKTKSTADVLIKPNEANQHINNNVNTVNPYRHADVNRDINWIENKINSKQAAANEKSDDTYWLLGFAMNHEEYNSMVSYMEQAEIFKDVESEKTISSFSTNNTSNASIATSATKEEVEMLERIVEAEATGEDMKGKILVANVIFNRMEDEEFPDTIEDVIFQKVGDKHQFSPIRDKRYWKVKVTSETKDAVSRALDGEDYSQGALYFMARKRARKSSTKWFDNNLDWLFKHGGHEFYK